MKITNFAILFFIIGLCVCIPMDSKMNNINAVSNKKVEYDMAFESAIDDAVTKLVEMDDNRQLVINKERCIQNFYVSLYANMGITTDKRQQELLRSYIPVILITDNDGYYIYYSDTYKNENQTLVSQHFTEKKPYAFEEGNYIYFFTFTDYLKLYVKGENELIEGRYSDLKETYPDLISEAHFDEIRRNAIVDILIGDMTYYVNQHNRIGEHYGITYNFALPYIQQEDWYRTIDDISMLAIFQGYPYGPGTTDVYNRYSLSGVRITKNKIYYLQDINGTSYYHKQDCPFVTDKANLYYSKKECAKTGAYPCMICNP